MARAMAKNQVLYPAPANPLRFPIRDGFYQARLADDLFFCIPRRYQIVARLGEGTQGHVAKAVDRVTGEHVTIKQIVLPDEVLNRGPFVSALRELYCMMHFRHDSIVKFLSLFTPAQTADQMREFYIVREYMSGSMKNLAYEDLEHIVVKNMFHDLLRGVQYMHAKGVAHFDLKPRNVLMNCNGDTKLCDFGQTMPVELERFLRTQYVVMRYYRSPELVCNRLQNTTDAVDIWSLGCIFAEFLTGEVLFPGESPLDQLDRIFQTLGTPDPSFFEPIPPNIRHFAQNLPFYPVTHISHVLQSRLQPKMRADYRETGMALDLLARMLVIEPNNRITMDEILQHPYLDEPVRSYQEGMQTRDNRAPTYYSWQQYADAVSTTNEIFEIIRNYCTENDIFNGSLENHEETHSD